jgi:hypothetical protein
MRSKSVLQVVVLAALAAGCGPASVPDRPSWDQDVFPILQGSCNHCHGASAGERTDAAPMGEPGPAGRLDICSNAPFASLGAIPKLGGGAVLAGTAGSLLTNLTPMMGKSRALMPPAPASELSDYDRDVLIKWGRQAGATGATPCNKQTRNRDPLAELVSKEVDGGDLVVTLQVSDPDGDQVLGKVAAGSAEGQTILSTGRRSFRFAGLGADSPVTVTLLDGYASPVMVTF